MNAIIPKVAQDSSRGASAMAPRARCGKFLAAAAVFLGANTRLRQFVLLAFLATLVACASDAKVATPSGPTEPYGGSPHAIPGRIEAEHYDEGKPGEAYSDVDAKNHGADYRGVTQVDIEKRADASNGHGIGWTRAGEWTVYTVKINEAGAYNVVIPVASNKKGGQFHLEVNGNDVSGPIDVPDTGSWQKLVVITKKNVVLPAGVHVLKMVMDAEGPSGSIADIDYLEFQKVRQ